MSVLAEPWRDPAMVRALIELLLLSLTAGTLGCWIVLYRHAYATEALAHALLPGVVGATMLGLPLLAGGAAGALAGTAAIRLARRSPLIDTPTAIAVATTTLLAAGALLAAGDPASAELVERLFGDLLAVGTTELVATGALAIVTVAALGLAHHRLLAAGFDRAAAKSAGLHVARIELLVTALAAVALLVALHGLGNLLVVAILVGPALSAARLSTRIGPMMALATLLTAGCSVAGLYLAHFAAIPAAAAVALVVVVLATTVELRRPSR